MHFNVTDFISSWCIALYKPVLEQERGLSICVAFLLQYFFPWVVIWEYPAESQCNCNFVCFMSLVVPNHTSMNHETNLC